MLAPLPPSSAPAPTGLGAAVAAAGGRLRALVRVLRHRSAVRRLLELDDRALKDIGLLRGDVLGVLARPLSSDPSAFLLVRAVERRAAGRAPATARQPVGRQRCRV
ncbi:MAG: hypothetical protein JWR86_3138 [Enterovirga sp.]|nr:hypothetical protein [Enterovirga sp.]